MERPSIWPRGELASLLSPRAVGGAQSSFRRGVSWQPFDRRVTPTIDSTELV